MQGFRSAVLVGVLAVALAGCGDKQEVMPPAQTPAVAAPGASATGTAPAASAGAECSPDYWKTLPEGKDRDALVERCMTQGSYQRSEPQAF
ncbi:hypothetical protein [Corticimicrobacter populi]|uniref:Entry exclusion lipoprotein TrbK n=1 Tax=Corticimicrobacter populi TaxID=2175229 RepID=A0A2V1JWZ0_9BURK|nr:hypothetical protein [Corticimicrobacter populi]PWF22992.1 hypothetical protein DD235_08255 [Corticimicrobacter populi]